MLHGQQNKRNLYNVARIYAQAAGRVSGDARQPYQRNRDNRSAYEERAVGLIRKALSNIAANQRAAFWRDYIETDAAFNPIRRSDEFSQLAAKYSRPAK